MDTLDTFAAEFDQVLLRDRGPLRRQWQRLQRLGQREDIEPQLNRLREQMQRAIQRRKRREAQLPAVSFDQPLPILEYRQAIAQALCERQTLVVAGETGSGKSTQLPKICLQAGLGRLGMIGHTQPRRIAARSIAARVAEELRVSLGRQVGYKIRFQDKTDPDTFIKLMTDGILLAETQSDRLLEGYEVIILDEAHERSLNIDFLLGYLKQTLARRPELHLIITSATIDAERFSEHFADAQGPAPIVEVSGRGFPVEVRYRPLVTDEGEEVETDEGIVAAIHELARLGRGDVLVFLPTERDIRELHRRLRGETFPGDGQRTTEILPLYARLSAREQNRIFQPSDYRRVVLATNVAESSLTVPNVHYVVDTGTARISRYSPRSRILRLPIEAVSQASANQRAGRCGRLAPGICIRLYDEDDFSRRDPFTTPEIRRTNLAAVILQAKALRLGEIEDFPFLDAPRPESVRDGYKTLLEIQALDRQRELTDIGRQLARMPVDPRVGRMILAGAAENCLHEVLIIASALELQDPRERPHDKQQQADERHAQFLDRDSDFISYLKIWDFYHHLKDTVSRNKLRRACQDNFLSYNRMREWTEIHRQLLEIADQHRLPHGPRRGDYAAIHRALLTGLLSGVAYRSGDREYTGAGGLQLNLWPGSGLFRQRHAWVMAAERVETSRRYARTVARISPTWVERLAEHLVKRSYSDPHWHRKSGTVMAYEKVSLMGMPVVVQRRVPYGPIDPATSRRVFIQAALVDQQVDDFDSFVSANRRLLGEIEQLAAKTRRRDYLLDEYTIFAFYNQRLPDDVYDVASCRRWLRADQQHRKQLTMNLEDLIDVQTQGDAQAFPAEVQVGNLRLPVSYNFNSAADDDGVTIRVPTAAVNQLSTDQLGWLVPGLLEEKVVALIRSLPKSLRRNFVPVPDTARQLVAELPFGQGSLLPTLASALSRIAGEVVRAGDFQLEKLPNHLRINIQVVDDQGQVQQMGRDLEQLQRLARPPDSTDEADRAAADQPWLRDGLTSWDFGNLPIEIPLVRGGIEVAAYPALIDRGAAVDLRLMDIQATADQMSRRGIARLYALAQRKSIDTQVRWLPRWNEICVWAAAAVSPAALKDDVILRIADMAFLEPEGLPRDEHEFRRRLERSAERIGEAVQQLAPLLPRLFEAYQQARTASESLAGPRDAEARADVVAQLQALFVPGFVADVPWNWLQQYPRYLQGIVYRIDRFKAGGQARDEEARRTVAGFWQRYVRQQHVNDQRQRFDPELVEFRWMIEELRVSLLAQPLGTAIKISPQRLERQWEKVQTG